MKEKNKEEKQEEERNTPPVHKKKKKKLIDRIRKISRAKKIIILVVVIAILVIAVFAFGKDENVEYVTAIAEKGDLLQTVSETGTVKAVEEIELSFLQSGKLGRNFYKIGDNVKKGQTLSELDLSSLLIRQKEAGANLEIAQANLDKLLAGASSAQIGVSQANVGQAEATYRSYLDELEKIKRTVNEEIMQAQQNLQDLESNSPGDVTPYEYAVVTAQTNLENTKNTYTQSVYNYQDASLTTSDNKLSVANTALDQVYQIINDNDKQKVLSVQEPIYLTRTELAYNDSRDLLTKAQNSLKDAKASLSDDDISQTLSDTLNCLDEVFDCLNYLYKSLEKSSPASYYTSTQIETDKTTISTHITNISTAISSVQSAQQNLVDAILTYDSKVSAAENSLATAETNLEDAIKTARNTLSTAKISGDQKIAASEAKVATALESLNYAKAQLNEVRSPARIQDVSLYQAQVRQVEAAYELVAQQIEDSIIKAPIDGTITEVNYNPGEQITIGSPVISVLGSNNFEVEIDISEADISKVNIDDDVEITLDAFGEDVIFSGKVSFIEPAETIIQDVIYYKVTVQFVEENNLENPYYNNIKSGMTANTIITTACNKDVVMVPSRAVLEKNGSGKYIRILDDGKIREVPVKTGLRGDGGMIEILSGLSEGEEVITFIKELD